MPFFRSRTVLEVARNLTAFLSFETGVTRGRLPEGSGQNGGATQERAQKAAPNVQSGHEREWANELERQVKSLNKELERAQADIKRRDMQFKRQSQQLERTRSRLAEKDSKITRLQNGILVRDDEEPALSEADEELMPPEELMLVGRGDKKVFKQVGDRQVELFVEFAGLKPDESVLDAGCGVGRIAIPLTKYLSAEGRYEGFDVVPQGIEWCRYNITPKYPNFRFQKADVYNRKYNPDGSYRASEYKFPYEDDSFDFVFLTSVFTHLLPEDTKNYLAEIARVLKSGGRCYITFFLLNEESVSLMGTEDSQHDFTHDYGEYRLVNERVPENAIAYDENYIRTLCEERELSPFNVQYGGWCGRDNFLTFQDAIIAAKS